MIAAATLENIVSWVVQVSVIATLAVLLPMVLRIRHPKSQLTYYHVVLMLCFALPFIQPWRSKLILVTRSQVADPIVMTQFSWVDLIVGIAALGVAAKLFWLAIGLWQLRRYRRSALPLYPLPQSIRDARLFTGTDAFFCISPDVAGPATIGYLDPVVLLPPTFLSLEEDAQRSVACHELLHVRRRDWLVTLLEELAGSLLWFQPAVRWLIGRIKLTREQVVDAEVVRMNPPAPYVEALLSMAVVCKPRLVLPAAPFFTEGHLAQRMRALLESPRRSFTRLCLSYASSASAIGLAGWTILVLFPLIGDGHIIEPSPQRLPTDAIAASQDTVPQPPRVGPNFTVRVPPPADESQDVVYFVNVEAPPPPPAHPVPPLRLFPQGVRVMRPGLIASPEEIEEFVASFPPPAVVEVVQERDGTVRKVMITRSPADGTTFNSLGVTGFFGGVDGPATTAGAANGEH
jgi:beta-lactamase regulating signal transducer with metallopeptidase domain